MQHVANQTLFHVSNSEPRDWAWHWHTPHACTLSDLSPVTQIKRFLGLGLSKQGMAKQTKGWRTHTLTLFVESWWGHAMALWCARACVCLETWRALPHCLTACHLGEEQPLLVWLDSGLNNRISVHIPNARSRRRRIWKAEDRLV
jgi:hypothetical protein